MSVADQIDPVIENEDDPVDNIPDAAAITSDRPVRKKTLTEKGLSYQVESLKKRLDSQVRKIDRECVLLGQYMEANNYELVQQAMISLDSLYSQAEEVNLSLVSLYPEEAKLAQQSFLEPTEDKVFQQKQEACKWLKENEPDARSSISSKRSSVRSKQSSRRSTHSRRDNKMGHNVEPADDKLAIQLELEKIKLKSKRLDLELTRSSSRDTIKRPPIQSSSDECPSNSMEAMMSMLNIQTAPNADLDVFSGDPLEYHFFKASFVEVVEKKVPDQKGRLTRLLKFTSGDAKDLIKHCILEEGACYDKAFQLLEKEYGNKQRLGTLYLNKLRLWPKVLQNDHVAYKKLHRFLLTGLTYKQGGKLCELDSESVIRTCVLAKLDRSVQEKWLNKVVRAREKKLPEKNFNDLVSFIEHIANLASEPSYSQQAYKNDAFKVLRINVPPKDKDINECLLCSGSHKLDECTEFKDLEVFERVHFLGQNRLCFKCLEVPKDGHMAKTCPKKTDCSECKGNHHALLHGYSFNSFKTHSILTDNAVSMCIIPVRLSHKDNPNAEVLTYALLDENAQTTFASEEVINKLPSVTSRKTFIRTETLNCASTDPTFALNNLIVKPCHQFEQIYGNVEVHLPIAYSRPSLSSDEHDIPTPGKIKQFPYLSAIANKLPEFDSSLQLGLIIGGNCPKALEPQEVIPSQANGPYGSRSLLGWRVVGPMVNTSQRKASKCFRTGVRMSAGDLFPEAHQRHLVPTTSCKEVHIENQLKEMYTHDFPEAHAEKAAMSNEDRKFLKMMDEGIAKIDGHYSLPLPFKTPDTQLSNNKSYALHRLESVKKKMQKDASFKKEYTEQIQKLINKGYASPSKCEPQGQTWYIPHFGVFEPSKSRYRVVFDCSARYKGICLNDTLLQGPDLTNLLVGVLLRFRKGQFAFMADIEAMFYQVRVKDQHQTFLKFLWWPEGNIEAKPEEFQMRVHLFGAISSPSCANFALRQTVLDAEAEETPAGKAVLNNFYVDDLLRSSDSAEEAVELMKNILKFCSSGGFNLTKFASNNKDILKFLPADKCLETSNSSQDIGKPNPIERALGVQWCLEADSLSFRISLDDKPLTRRGILSTISSVYDPLGLASPFLLRGRKILQQITALRDGWDKPVPSELANQWSLWRAELPKLAKLSVSRCYKSDELVEVKNQSLHVFSDASEFGYGVACYLRQVDIKGQVSVSLVLGKSRVAPLKTITIPRLELTAATLSVKLSSLVKDELQLDLCPDEVFWTDSMITLGYITNDVRRFRVFVANRCQKIRAYSQKSQWNHVESTQNPADHASRGIAFEDEEKVSQWFEGPAFLLQPNQDWNNSADTLYSVDSEDKEIRCFTVKAQLHAESTLYRLENISSWQRIIRVVATLYKFMEHCKDQSQKSHHISVNNMLSAERAVLKMIQKSYLSEELKFYSTKKVTDKGRKSSLYRLDPFIDSEGLLRVGGRLSKSDFDVGMSNPIILPKQCIISQRIVEYYHARIMHAGRTSTLNELRRQGFWLVSANSIVRRVIHRCVTCRSTRGKSGQQKMANIPAERFTTEGPFCHVGVDVFGPFYIKDGRKQVKRFVVLFTCFASRAIHLECIFYIDTDSFILALRRFMSRRGPVRQIFSDNGTNFVGAANEFKKAYKEMDVNKINNFLVSESCDWIQWKRNPPHSSHFGGVWERQIRSVRSVLSAVFKEHSAQLNDESFRTVLAEAECIVNSRPLSVEDLGDPTSMPISPNSLLTMKSKIVLPPPGEFQRADMYCRKRWRQVQYVANQFWYKWRLQYINSLQERSKWQQAHPNFEIGDIVLVQDENLPRNQWPLARVIEVYPDTTDKLVRHVKLFVPTAKSDLERPIHKLVLLVENRQSDCQSYSPRNVTPNHAVNVSGQDQDVAVVTDQANLAAGTSKKKAVGAVADDVDRLAVISEVNQEETVDNPITTPRVQKKRIPRALKRLESVNNKGIKE